MQPLRPAVSAPPLPPQRCHDGQGGLRHLLRMSVVSCAHSLVQSLRFCSPTVTSVPSPCTSGRSFACSLRHSVCTPCHAFLSHHVHPLSNPVGHVPCHTLYIPCRTLYIPCRTLDITCRTLYILSHPVHPFVTPCYTPVTFSSHWSHHVHSLSHPVLPLSPPAHPLSHYIPCTFHVSPSCHTLCILCHTQYTLLLHPAHAAYHTL